MKRIPDSFRFPAELGKKLHELRLRAGLGLEELAHRMGRSKGYVSRLSQLENGRTPFPSLALVCDYLRVCRASFAELVPILDSYTSKPVQLELAGRQKVKALLARLPAKVATELNRYDVKTTYARREKGQTPLEPDERELRVRKQAQSWFERGRLDAVLNQEMDNLGVLPVVPVRKFVFDYGHKLWKILKQTRTKPGEIVTWRQRTREARLTQAEKEALKQEFVPIEGLALIQKRTRALFEQMERDGELDRLPTLAEAGAIEKPLSLQFRPRARIQASGPALSESGVNSRLLAHVKNLVSARLTAEGIRGDRFLKLHFWLNQVQLVAVETEPGSVERKERAEALIAATSDQEASRHCAELYFEVFEAWRPRLFPA